MNQFTKITTDDEDVSSPVIRLSRDLARASATLNARQARFMVDGYYIFQEDRKRAEARIRKMEETHQPHQVLDWFAANAATLEGQVKRVLGNYSKKHPIGKWMLSHRGVGPVIAAGYLASIDITKATTAGKIWALCGLAPGRDQRIRGQKFNFDPSLKRLSWILGDQFKRHNKHPDAFYGKLYAQRKTYEAVKNENGDYAEQAAKILAAKRFGDNITKKIYETGKLPPAHLDRRASRWATKIFLSHLHEVWWEFETGTTVPKPYALAHLGHVDYIPPPNRHLVGKKAEA